jgi:hypothetical protein
VEPEQLLPALAERIDGEAAKGGDLLLDGLRINRLPCHYSSPPQLTNTAPTLGFRCRVRIHTECGGKDTHQCGPDNGRRSGTSDGTCQLNQCKRDRAESQNAEASRCDQQLSLQRYHGVARVGWPYASGGLAQFQGSCINMAVPRKCQAKCNQKMKADQERRCIC